MKRTLWILGIGIIGIIGMLLISGCVETEKTPIENKTATITFVDDLNRTVEIPKNPKRIVSLDSGAIEILYTLNASEKAVGRPSYLKYPKDALKLPDCGGIYHPNFEVIVNLHPDVVIVTWIHGRYAGVIKRFETYNVSVVGFDWPNTIPSLMNYIIKIGKISGKEKEAENLINDMTTRIEKITNITSRLDESQKPRVFIEMRYTRSKKEIKTYGRKANLKTALVEAAGGKNIFANITGYTVSSEEVIKRNPQVIIISVSSNTFSPDEYGKLVEDVKNRPGWNKIDAVKNNRICVISSSLASTNPRIVQGLEEYAKCIHPEIFNKTSTKTE